MGELSGTGVITANGGNGATGGGAGGGGRIAVAHGPDSSSVIANLSVVGGTAGSGAGGVGTIYTLSFSAPDASSIVSPATGSYNAALNPVLTSAAYGNSPGNLAHLSSDWKVTTDSDGLTLVWFATGDTVNKVSTQVNVVNGTFTGALTGQTALAASSTYYAFVRHTNSFGTAVWSSGISFATPYAGVSSTLPFLFDDQSPATVFNYDPDFIEINASGNGLARLKDLGGGTYVGVGLVGYPIYKELSILNNVAETFTNAQVSTTVVYASGMQSDFDDIRFTADDGVTLLDHYRVSKTDGVSAVFHIKVPSLPASATTIVRMYYGNADVASASDFLSTGQRSYVSDAGLRAEWLMDEGSGSAITDTSGNGNNGTYTYNGSGGWLGSDSRFSTGDATKYDGSGDAISTPVSITGLTDDFSLETWAYSDSDGSGWGWFFGESGGGTFLLGKTWFNSSLHYNMDGLGSGNTAAGTFTAGSWHHIVFSHDKGASNATKIYVNGSLVAAINAPAWSPTTAGNFILGARSNGETFTGKLDSARVYTRALSAAEVLAHYQSRSYFSTDPTVTFGAAQPSALFAQSTISVSADGNHPSVLSVYRMEETLAPGSTGTVTYQLSVDGSTWKYWNGSAWATASDDTAYTNTSSTMNAYLPLFVSQVGLGDLYVRALFTSNGSQPVGLDALKFFYAPTNLSPDAPTLLGPASLVDGSTTSTVTPAFVFTLNDADGSDALKYQIQIDDSSDFSSPVIDYTSDLGDQGERSFRVGQAAGSGSYVPGQDAVTLPSGSYYWRVKAIDPVAAESSYTTANSGSMAFTIDSGTRTVSFAYSTMSSLESVTATSVRVVLDTTHFEDVEVGYAITGGTATGSGTDYTLAAGTATITAGETSTTIALIIVNDEIDEPNETFVITLASPVYASLGATDALTYTITDDDTAGITSSESAFSLTEGGSSDSFTLVLTSKPTSTVTIAFTTSTAGITLVPDALAFTTDNWATPQTVTISATDDSRYESSHTTSVVMTVSGGVYGYPLITPPTITATITDNETSDITLSASTLAVTEGSFGTLTFVLASQPTSTVTLVFATPSESALSASSLTFTADNWSTSQMLTVNILNNRDYVGTRTATLTTTVTSDTTFSQVAVPTVTITINEDDAPPGGGAVTAGPGAFYVPFPLDYVPPVTTVPALPPQTGGEASSPAPVTDAPTAPSAPASNQARTQVSSDATSFRVTLAPQDQERLASFVDTGTSQATQALGSGERRALVRDALDTMGRAPTQTDLERLAQGQIPQTRNLTREREQLPRARSTFRTIYGRDPNFQNAQENLAWNTLMYRIRFTRDLAQEREGITTFRQTFRRAPSDPFQWAVVRVLGYVR